MLENQHLFNKLVGGQEEQSLKKLAELQEIVTTENLNGTEKKFSVIDTGGYVSGSDDIFEGEIRRQVKIAIDEATVIIFVVDVETGITDLDESVAKILRSSEKPIIVVANKVDNNERISSTLNFINLGWSMFLELALLMVLAQAIC